MNAPSRCYVGFTGKDSVIAWSIINKLRGQGASVSYDKNTRRKDFQAELNRTLKHIDWFIVVQTSAALRSKILNQEIELAIQRKAEGSLKDIIRFVAESSRPKAIPTSWQDIEAFDATVDWDRALAEMVNALGFGPVAVQPFIPDRLQSLGFIGKLIQGIEVIIPPLCDIPKGPFLMGSDPAIDSSAREGERPQHLVTLPAYQIMTYPLTVAEYTCFLRATGYYGKPTYWNDLLRTRDHPMVGITWFDFLAYAKWLTDQTGQHWRLPTEAEWEKAARGTDGRVYPWGNQFEGSRANTKESGITTTTAIGSYPLSKSPYGVQEVAGNIWEWTTSRLLPFPYQLKASRDLRRPAMETVMIRGGSWDTNSAYARAACREYVDTFDFSSGIGGRLVCEDSGLA